MNQYLKFAFLLLISLNLNAQPIESKYYTLKHDSLFLFIDNAKECWYTIELQTDTLFQVEGNIFYCDGKVIQVNSVLFGNGQKNGVMGSITAAKHALYGHKKWELDYQQENLGKRLKDGDELFFDNNGKPFLIWWYKIPKNLKVPVREIEFEAAGITNMISNTSAVELQVTHQLFLDFVVQSNTSVSICFPVYENENIEKVKRNLKAIAKSLKVYGSYIDLSILEQRTKNAGKFIFQDSLSLIEIEAPEWLNILKIPIDNSFFGSFPEKENIYNAVGISWTYKSDTIDFQKFMSYYQNNRNRENVRIISDDGNVIREFYTSNNSFFYCEDVYLKSDHLYCYVNFTATKSTYNINIERFNELLKNIVLKKPGGQ